MIVTDADVKALLEKVSAGTMPNGNVSQVLPPTPPSSDEAVIVHLNENPYTLAKLEKHLRDDARGEGYKSSDGYNYTIHRENEALNTLANTDSKGFLQATSFLSGQTSYGYRVRAVEGIRQAAITSAQLQSLAAQLKSLKK